MNRRAHIVGRNYLPTVRTSLPWTITHFMILRILRNTDQGIGSYVWKAGLIAVVPSLVVSFVLTTAMQSGPGPMINGPAITAILGVLILSPWLETLLMWPILWLLQKFMENNVAVAATSAAVWGVLHSLSAPFWGIVIVWPFFVFSLCFLEWRRISIRKAILATGLTHTCQNILPAMALAATL